MSTDAEWARVAAAVRSSNASPGHGEAYRYRRTRDLIGEPSADKHWQRAADREGTFGEWT